MKIVDLFSGSALERSLRKLASTNKGRILLVWNRGLGDIPLGIYAFYRRIYEILPHASISVLTRPSLSQGFEMLGNVRILVDPTWVRGKEISIRDSLHRHHLTPEMFDHIFPFLDLDRWFRWQVGKVVPKLHWKEEWDQLAEKFLLDKEAPYVAIHVQTETQGFYDRDRDWPLSYWPILFRRILSKEKKIILLGSVPNPSFLLEGVVDLRGKTSVLEMVAIIKQHCSILVGPDSGVISTLYFLNSSFPLRLISLWGSPKWGILRQNVPSPNPQLVHIPLKGKKKRVSSISVESVYHAMELV